MTSSGQTSYSGCDIRAFMTVPGEDSPGTFEINNLSAISVSTYRELVPVRTLGRATPFGYTRGARTIAGTLAFLQGTERTFVESLRHVYGERIRYMIVDQLPPFDVTITMQSELPDASYLLEQRAVQEELQFLSDAYMGGTEQSPARARLDDLLNSGTTPHGSVLRVSGIRIVSTNEQHTVNDLSSEEVFQYVASGFAPLISTRILSGSSGDESPGSSDDPSPAESLFTALSALENELDDSRALELDPIWIEHLQNEQVRLQDEIRRLQRTGRISSDNPNL